MKNTLIILLLLALVGTGAYIFLEKNGYSDEAIFTRPLNYDLNVDCSEITNLLVTSEVDVTVRSSDRTHNNVTVLITAYDKNGNTIKQKRTTFERTLKAHESLLKLITLPAKTRRCDCVIESSIPN